MKPFKIRDILIDPPLILSPMAGVTDYTFRRLIKRRGGVGLVVSEFISVEGLTRHNPKSKRQMRFDQEERPYAVQIFGGKPDRMAMGAEMAQEVGADILDVNCGCPAPKVVKNGGGSGLLREPALLETILKEIKKTITIPLTLKLRTGYTESSINVVGVAKMAEQCGVEHIQVHGRTRSGLQRPCELGTDTSGKGGGQHPGFRQRRHHNYQVRYGPLGRIRRRWHSDRPWCDANPWIFRQFADALAGREPYQPDLREKKGCVARILFDVPRRNA
ncbi:MAG: tRNA-dihydrouridine synthase [Chloracidobacterium sp.]|nr:tRNA-dihydrouridine synthase [Chloracidobacterium sp.]